KEKEAELMLQQIEDEAKRREDEDAKIRDLENYKRRVENERKQRELRDEMDRQRLSGAIMRQQLAELTTDYQPGPTRASSVVSAVSKVSRSSSHLSLSQNPTRLNDTPTGCNQTSNVSDTSSKLRTSAILTATQPDISSIPAAGQAFTVITPSVASTSRIPTPTRLFAQSTVTTPLTPSVGILGMVRNLANKVFTPGSSLKRSTSAPQIPTNAGSVTTASTVNPRFSTPLIASTVPQPITTSHVTPPVSFNVTPVQISAPLPLGTTTTAAQGSSWRNLNQQNSFGPTPTSQPPAQPSTRLGLVNQGPSEGPGLSTHVPTMNLPPPASSFSYTPAVVTTISSLLLPTSSINTGSRQTSMSFPGNVAATSFVPANPTYSTGFPGPYAPPPTVLSP
ncbi:Uncharacterized protein APZ42_003562, partial [Daphnia magna]